MIAARAAAVRTVSTLRLVSGAAAFSELALGAGAGPLGALGTGAGVDGCAAGLLKATDCANADGEAIMAETGALLTGALWRPTE
jgi:hypothetical protein